MTLPNEFDPLLNKDPELYQQISALKQLAFAPGALENKTKCLVALAINVCLERNDKSQCAVSQALAAGATEQEIKEVLRLTYFVRGLSTAQTITQLAPSAAR